MRSNARFALQLTGADGPLPHAREIKVQTGGLLGLQALLYPERTVQDNVDDIISLIETALQSYQGFDELPYGIINQAIVKFEGRRKKSRSGKD